MCPVVPFPSSPWCSSWWCRREIHRQSSSFTHPPKNSTQRYRVVTPSDVCWLMLPAWKLARSIYYINGVVGVLDLPPLAPPCMQMILRSSFHFFNLTATSSLFCPAKNVTTAAWPLRDAKSSAVAKVSVVIWGSALASISSRTRSKWPSSAARCRGVDPSVVHWSFLAPASMSKRAIWEPLEAAMCNATYCQCLVWLDPAPLCPAGNELSPVDDVGNCEVQRGGTTAPCGLVLVNPNLKEKAKNVSMATCCWRVHRRHSTWVSGWSTHNLGMSFEVPVHLV